jgi:hypothetical protein
MGRYDLIGRSAWDHDAYTVLSGRKNTIQVHKLFKHRKAQVLSGVNWILSFLVPARV